MNQTRQRLPISKTENYNWELSSPSSENRQPKGLELASVVLPFRTLLVGSSHTPQFGFRFSYRIHIVPSAPKFSHRLFIIGIYKMTAANKL